MTSPGTHLIIVSHTLNLAGEVQASQNSPAGKKIAAAMTAKPPISAQNNNKTEVGTHAGPAVLPARPCLPRSLAPASQLSHRGTTVCIGGSGGMCRGGGG